MMFWQPKSALEPIQLWGAIYGVERGGTVVAYHGDDLAPMYHRQRDTVWRMRDDHWIPVTDLTIERAVLAQAATVAVSVPAPLVITDRTEEKIALSATIDQWQIKGWLRVIDQQNVELISKTQCDLVIAAGWARASDTKGHTAQRRLADWARKNGVTFKTVKQ